MIAVGVRELKARLSSYIEIARGGEEVVVTARGREVAVLVPITKERMALKRLSDGGEARMPRGKPKGARGWGRLAVVDFREVEAGRLAAKYGLRGFDAIHLSSAMTIASAPAGPDVLFSSFDAALNRAASGERLQVLAPRCTV